MGNTCGVLSKLRGVSLTAAVPVTRWIDADADGISADAIIYASAHLLL